MDIQPGSIIHDKNPPVKIVGEMTLRDYFATQAMQGLLANGWLAEERDINLQAGYHEIAVDAYMMAEAMLKARKRYAEKS
jgi:hypothetical protein